jgi:uncharacterized protein (DUF1697 family)
VTAYVALLRGVNVGGNKKVPMAELRAAATGCGFEDVATYIQSGNVVFTSRQGAKQVASDLHNAILAEIGVDTRVVTRTVAQMQQVVAKNPFLARGVDPKLLHVVFLYEASTPKLDAVDPTVYAPDEIAVVGTEAFISVPNGLGRSKLGTDTIMRKLGLLGTTRNWRTCTTLAEMAGALS